MLLSQKKRIFNRGARFRDAVRAPPGHQHHHQA
jgi:hypothetical protein